MNGADLIAQERQRQIDGEGYDAGHDDEHDMGELAAAAMCYADLAVDVEISAIGDRSSRFNGGHSPITSGSRLTTSFAISLKLVP